MIPVKVERLIATRKVFVVSSVGLGVGEAEEEQIARMYR